MPDPVLLYVEDEDATAFLFEAALAEANLRLQVFRVTDGEQALCFLRKQRAYEKVPTPDLVLLDLNLPKVSGLQVLAAMHEDERLRDIPVNVFTSSGLASDRRQAMALGAKHYTTKPSNLDSFLEAVRNNCKSLAES